MKSLFSFLRRKKQEPLTEQDQSFVDKHEAMLHDKYLSEFNGYVEKHIRNFAKKHRTSVKECDVYQLKEVTRNISNYHLGRFLGYSERQRSIALYFPESSMCLRRKNAFFIVTHIECFSSGKAKISYRTKVQHHIIEHEEIV